MTTPPAAIPEWAKKRACELAREWNPHTTITPDKIGQGLPEFAGFARYIAAHEQPPVDPLVELMSDIHDNAHVFYANKLREALAKRGLEIREVQP